MRFARYLQVDEVCRSQEASGYGGAYSGINSFQAPRQKLQLCHILNVGHTQARIELIWVAELLPKYDSRPSRVRLYCSFDISRPKKVVSTHPMSPTSRHRAFGMDTFIPDLTELI